ncbi:hypothetical protein [Virgibacillus salexigens]|uniref:hypothetical protein n=1 Tax=Virgibacillus salexigens TaxID=61016 RepID=UPI00190C34E6|nr:hypothetical protein [Virgibacillus salexigens]
MNEGWIEVISVLLITFSLYFALSFIESLHKNDERVTKQSKFGAIICLGIALLLPVMFNLFQ